MGLCRGRGLLGGRCGGRCVSGENRTREQGQGNDWDELLEHRFGLQGKSRKLRRGYYDWIQVVQVPYDRKVMLAMRRAYPIEKQKIIKPRRGAGTRGVSVRERQPASAPAPAGPRGARTRRGRADR